MPPVAHYRLETKIIGRQTKTKEGVVLPGRQTSSLAKAAYRSGQLLKDERIDKTFNYRSRTQEVAYSEIMSPENAPAWLKGNVPEANGGTRKQRDLREKLWNTIELVEKRKDSQLAREFIASLPRGLNREQQVELVRGWCQAEFVDAGFVVDFAIHKSKGGTNPHAHILVTTRPVTVDGFGKKPDTAGKFNGRGAAGLGAKDELLEWRESWCAAENAALEKAGRPERADHRSLKDRGIDQLPEPKLGVEASAMKRKDKKSDPRRFQFARLVKMQNEVRKWMAHWKQPSKSGDSLRLHRSVELLAEFGGRIIHEVKDKWTMLVDAQRANPPKSGPDR